MFSRILSLIRHTAIYGTGDLLGRAVAVVLVPIYARHLTLADNGVISLAFAITGFSAVFYSLGLNPALIRILSNTQEPLEKQKAFSSAYWTLLGVGLCLSTLIYLNAHTCAQSILNNIEHTHIFYYISGILLLDTLSEPFFTLCRVQKRSTRYTLVRLVQYTLQLGLTAYLIAIKGQGPEAVFQANLLSSLFAFVVISPVGLTALRLTFQNTALRDLLSFGLPFVPSAISVLVINLSDRFLIQYFLGVEALGIYGITYKLGLPMFFIIKAFRAAWAPAVLDSDDHVQTSQMCARITTYYAVIGSFLCLILATFSHECIVLIAGSNAQDYLVGKQVIPLVALAFFFYGLYVIITAGVYIHGKANALPAIVGAGAILNILLNVFLLPKFGFVAAAWSTLVAYIVMVVLLYLFVRQFYPVPYEFARLGKIAIAGTIVYIATSDTLSDTSSEGTVARLIFLLGYPLILWGWQVVEPKELKQLAVGLFKA
ncbi:MAG: flippase [Candidatus Latescibacteria bacterium]|jgi:O-antigen/teichoic acid export membrane protein|nr:flippase [Candidatus Latescibacterota bacterium]MBT4137773.1 flippase [Candidatus Latescibacterota bacterium]MBT5833034.1 flippase [Candidatus Latescibacterota bacterium]